MRRLLVIICLLIVSCAAIAQENPAPVPPNYELIRKETKRWFGEFRYKKLQRRFNQCDTTMTVDHFRCLYYGSHRRRMSGEVEVKVVDFHAQYRADSTAYGAASPVANASWWRLQMLIAAVWSSGNGSREYPFYVTNRDDLLFMVEDMGLHHAPDPSVAGEIIVLGEPLAVHTTEGVTVYVVIEVPQW